MRLAHANVAQQLADWCVVLMHDGTPPADCSNADYCLVKLKNAYDAGDGSPHSTPIPLSYQGVAGRHEGKGGYLLRGLLRGRPRRRRPPSSCGPEPTRTIEFNSNGTVRTLRPGTSGTVRVSSDDGNPSCGLVFQAATARVRVGPIVYE